MSVKVHGYRHPEDNVINVPTVAGVQYQIDGETVTGAVTVNKSVTLKAVPVKGYRFPEGTVDSWRFVWKDDPKDVPKS